MVILVAVWFSTNITLVNKSTVWTLLPDIRDFLLGMVILVAVWFSTNISLVDQLPVWSLLPDIEGFLVGIGNTSCCMVQEKYISG